MSDAPVTGGCYCGEIRYEADPPVLHSTVCYCANCRRAAGAQSVAWMTFRSSGFRLTKGNPVRYRTDTEAWRTFCGSCGTSLTYENDDRPEDIDITTGSTDDPAAHPPTKPIFDDERLTWDVHPSW
jgi:hypothetical protein